MSCESLFAVPAILLIFGDGGLQYMKLLNLYYGTNLPTA